MLNASHLARVDVNLLVLLHVVLEEGHVGRAAERLRLTSSAVSHGLARLRRLFDDPLFLRTPKGIVPTARALTLREPVAEILSLVQDVLRTAVPFDLATSNRRFVIGAPDAVLASMASLLLKRISAVAPRIDIGLVHLMPQPRERPTDNPWSQCLNQIEQREVDVRDPADSRVASSLRGALALQRGFCRGDEKGAPLRDRSDRGELLRRTTCWFRLAETSMASSTRRSASGGGAAASR